MFSPIKPTAAFFDTLGDYVYMYRSRTLGVGPAYVGKGTGGRCLSHLKDKGYSIDDCVIVARNLEKFKLDEKDASFVLESYLIAHWSPEDNSVSGHYKDCFVMADLSKLFGSYVDSQRNMFSEISDLVLSNSEVFNNIGYTETRASSYIIETPAKDNIYFGIKVQTKDPQITCYVKANGDKYFKALVAKCDEVLSEYTLDSKSNKNQINFQVESLEEAMELWTSFAG